MLHKNWPELCRYYLSSSSDDSTRFMLAGFMLSRNELELLALRHLFPSCVSESETELRVPFELIRMIGLQESKFPDVIDEYGGFDYRKGCEYLGIPIAHSWYWHEVPWSFRHLDGLEYNPPVVYQDGDETEERNDPPFAIIRHNEEGVSLVESRYIALEKIALNTF